MKHRSGDWNADFLLLIYLLVCLELAVPPVSNILLCPLTKSPVNPSEGHFWSRWLEMSGGGFLYMCGVWNVLFLVPCYLRDLAKAWWYWVRSRSSKSQMKVYNLPHLFIYIYIYIFDETGSQSSGGLDKDEKNLSCYSLSQTKNIKCRLDAVTETKWTCSYLNLSMKGTWQGILGVVV